MSGELKDLNAQYSTAQAQVTLLKERYGEEHPKLIQAEKLVEELKNEVAKADADANTNIGTNTEYSMLKLQADSYRNQLNSTLKEQQDNTSLGNVAIPGLRISDEAELPYAPIRPDKSKSTAIGGFIGLLCGLGFIIALYFVDSSIRTVSQAENTFNLP